MYPMRWVLSAQALPILDDQLTLYSLMFENSSPSSSAYSSSSSSASSYCSFSSSIPNLDKSATVPSQFASCSSREGQETSRHPLDREANTE
eukprot:768426-Hanusia_phi.AAC.6